MTGDPTFLKYWARQGSIHVNIQAIFNCMVIQTHPITASQKGNRIYDKVISVKLQKCLRC